MANMFDRYGIKEVCDVTFYAWNKTANDYTDPVLYLDTLKVSTMEQTAENTSARGGKGNPELIMWDYNKEITVTLEDALFSAKSMAMMFGDENIEEATSTSKKSIHRTISETDVNTTASKAKINGKWYTYTSANSISGAGAYDVVFDTATAFAIEISFNTFPGTYKVVGDTYARSEDSGEDSFFQLIFNKAKVQSEVTLTMEAEGDPSTFSMNLKVLRPGNNKPMVELIKYDLEETTAPSI